MQENAQLVEIVLGEDPVVVCFQAELLFGSSQTQKNAQAAFTILHHAQLLLDGCRTGVSHHITQSSFTNRSEIKQHDKPH